MNISWRDYFIKLAETVSSKSKDNHTKIGVVIVGSGNEIVSTGFNSFARGVKDGVKKRQHRPEKYYWFAHAERNAIYNAARIGVSTLGCRMYCTCGIPCSDCAIAIIQAGIKEVWVNQMHETGNPKKWIESTKRSLQMFKEAKVKIKYYNND